MDGTEAHVPTRTSESLSLRHITSTEKYMRKSRKIEPLQSISPSATYTSQKPYDAKIVANRLNWKGFNYEI